MSMRRLTAAASLMLLAIAPAACKPAESTAADEPEEAVHNLRPPEIIVPDAADAPEPVVIDEASRAIAALEDFYDLIEARRIRKARQMVLEPGEARRVEALASNLGYTGQLMSQGKLTIEVLDARSQGRWTVVATRVKTPGKVRERDEFLYLQDGDWLVAPEMVRADERNQALVDDDFLALLDWYRNDRHDTTSADEPGDQASTATTDTETTVPLERRRIPGVAVSMLLPESFVPMTAGMLERKYPNGNRPEMAYTNETGSVNIAINHTGTRLTSEQLPMLHRTMDRQFRSMQPTPTFHRSEMTTIGGRGAMLLDFTSSCGGHARAQRHGRSDRRRAPAPDLVQHGDRARARVAARRPRDDRVAAPRELSVTEGAGTRSR